MRIAILLRFRQRREQSIMDKPISIPSPQLLASNSIRHSKLCGSALKQVRYNDLGFRLLQYLLTAVLIQWACRLAFLSTLVLLCLGVVSAQVRPPEDGARERAIMEIQTSINQGNLPAAREQLRASAKQFGRDAGFDNLAGIIEAQEHNYSAAEADFKRAIQRQRHFTAAYLNLARLYRENSSTDSQASRKALLVYDTVLSYELSDAEANYQSALLLLEAGKYQT